MKYKLVLMLATGLLAVSCSDKNERQAKAPTRVVTEVVTASHGACGQSYVGIVEEREATAVSFTGMGVVKRVLVDEGQTVSRGQLIAEMDDTQARNRFTAAEAQMAQADDALQRYGMLHDNGSLPEAQWVEIQSQVAQAKAQLEVARKNLSDCRLVAPVSGVIGRKQVGAGETALPSQAVVSILDISSVKVRVAVPEAEIGGISSNSSSTIWVEAIQDRFSGGRIEKGVQADALTHTYDVHIEVNNARRRLLPGMVASVSISPAQTPADSDTTGVERYLVPVTSVQRMVDGRLFVWTVDNDSTARRAIVTIAETEGNRVTVNSGLHQHQRIITEGYQKLSEGTRVRF